MPNTINLQLIPTDFNEGDSIWAQTWTAAVMASKKLEKEEPEVAKKKPKKLEFARYFEGIFKGFKRAETGRYGIEIETEAKGLSSYPKDFLVSALDPVTAHSYWETPSIPMWKAVKDGSLRNFGVEFIFKGVYTYEETKKALDEFMIGTSKVKFLDGEVGTSVHVHCNVQNENLVFLGNFLTNLILFENLLVEFSGETRRANLFALPTKSAEGNLHNIVRMFKELEKGNLRAINHDENNVKYAAINICNLSTLGSIEIRCFRGTTNTNAIYQWVSLLNKIYEASKIPGLTPVGIMEDMRRRPHEYFSEVFGNLKSLLQTRDFERLLLSPKVSGNLFYASQLSKACDWGSLDEKVWGVVEQKESGKKGYHPSILSYVAKYGGDPDELGVTSAGVVVTKTHPDSVGNGVTPNTPETFPYPIEGNEKVEEDLVVIYDDEEGYIEEDED